VSGMLAPEVLVLGASGRVGAGVVAALLEAGSPVLAVGRDAGRLRLLAERHADEPALETLAGSVAGEREAARLAARVARRPRRLRAVVDAVGAPRTSARLLDRPAAFLRRTLDLELMPRLTAARHLLPLLGENEGQGRYLLIGGPHAKQGWAGYGHASVSEAAMRMLARVLHEEALPLGVHVHLLSVDAPVWTPENAASACAGWPSALAVGRNAVALLGRDGPPPPPVVPYSARHAMPPGRMLACDFADALPGIPACRDAPSRRAP